MSEPGNTHIPGMTEMLREYNGRWPLDEFIARLSRLREIIPEGARKTAVVHLDTLPYDHIPSLTVLYAADASAPA